ncbi:radical SAM/SPASM domain-containing protein [Desulfovibrionales bacterium]
MLFQRIYIEITNVCNLHCSFCTGTTRPSAFMSQDFFDHAVRQAKPLTTRICLHVLGEPCLHPDLEGFLAACLREELDVELTTNGTILSEKAHIVLASAVRQINISVHNVVDGEEINWNRLDEVLDFVRHALRTRPDLYINLRLWNRSATEKKDPNVHVRAYMATRLGVPCPAIPAGRKSRCLIGRLYLHQDTRFTWPGEGQIPTRHSGFCHALSTHCAILVDGTVCPCCLDAEGRLALGSLQHNSLDQIIQSPRATAMREGFARGLLVEKLCQSCDYCRRFPPRRHRR